MTKDAENISIAGIKGLKIYGMDFSAATLDGPAELTALLASETNSFINGARPSLSYLNPVSISIGNLRFNMFAVSQSVVKSSSGENYLKMKYVDGSFILDKYYVALKSKHWEYFDPNNTPPDRLKSKAPYKEFIFNANPTQPKYNLPNNFIMVGRYIDPCKSVSLNTQTAQDPCDPCPKTGYEDQEAAKLIDCLKERSLNLLDVEYTFDDLITAIKSKGLRVNVIGTYNPLYKGKYTGSLRTVMQSWCSDFGLAFVYNAQSSEFKIFDPKVGIAIPSISSCLIVGESEETSIEHNFAKGVVTRYSKPGQERDYDCEASYSQVISCRPLTFQDLMGKAKWREGMPLYSHNDQQLTNSHFDLIEFVCMLSSYDPHLRECLTWFDLYGCRTAEYAKKLVTSIQTSSGVANLSVKCGGYTGSGLNDDFSKKKFSLPLLAMTLKAVIGKSDPQYSTIYNKLGEAGKRAIDDAAKDGFTKPYFFIAYQDKQQFQNMVTWEQNLGRNFLGKYFIRKFNSSMNANPEFTPAADANVKFYKQRIDNVEFGSIIPYKGSYIDELAASKSPQSPDEKAKESFILVSRNTTFVPPVQEGSEVANLIKLAERALPIDLGSVLDILGTDNTVKNPHPQAKESGWSGEDHLYVAFEGNGFSPSVNTSPVNFPELGWYFSSAPEYAIPTKLGLQSLKCISATVKGVTLYYPPSSTVRESANGGRGYDIFYKASSSASHKLFIPKVEFVEPLIPNVLAENVPNFDLNVKEFSNGLLPDLIYRQDTKTCLPNERDIRKAMGDFNKNLSVVQTNNFIKKTYEIDGVPSISSDAYVNIESFAIRISDKGIRTDITFSNLRNRKILASDALLEHEFLENFRPPYVGHHQFRKGTNLLSSTNNKVNPSFTDGPSMNQPIY